MLQTLQSFLRNPTPCFCSVASGSSDMHREIGASHPQGEKYLNLTTMLRNLPKRWAEFLWISQIPAWEKNEEFAILWPIHNQGGGQGADSCQLLTTSGGSCPHCVWPVFKPDETTDLLQAYPGEKAAHRSLDCERHQTPREAAIAGHQQWLLSLCSYGWVPACLTHSSLPRSICHPLMAGCRSWAEHWRRAAIPGSASAGRGQPAASQLLQDSQPQP